MPKALRLVVALSVTIVLLVALGGLAMGASPASQASSTALAVTTQAQVGDPAAVDPKTGKLPEDPPYTKAEDIFNPQLAQAPVKDSVTWNPVFMSEFETTEDPNGAVGLYNQIYAGSRNATEKVFFRMWYEPWHWDKDWNANGTLDLIPELQIPYTLTKGIKYDEWYPAIMQEFTYMLLEAKTVAEEPLPLAGPVDRSQGGVSFVFPVGIEGFPAPDPAGNGLNTFDADLDQVPDIVHVESEVTLFELTKIAADFNGNGLIDNLDADSVALNGNEWPVFRLDSKSLGTGQGDTQELQFLDHYIKVLQVFDDSVLLEIWYTGDLLPARLGTITLYTGDMVLAGRNGPAQRIKAVVNGGSGTNMCHFPTGPWFAWLESIDTAEDTARIVVGRALGATHTAMEESPGQADLFPGDPWFLKRFYVDGHEYNVVAVQTENGAPTTVPHVCTLDANEDREVDYTLYPPPHDPSFFKFITIRTPIPKVSDHMDPPDGYLIEQHSVRLQAYGPHDPLSVLPPFNHPHYVLLDVQVTDGVDCDEKDVAYIGKLVGPVDAVGDDYYYIEEDKNWQLLGELKEKYGEHAGDEFWYVEQFHTRPWEYTEFVLPNISPATTGITDPDLYLMTSSWLARQSEYLLWTKDAKTPQAYNLVWDKDEGCWIRKENVSTMPKDWKPRVKFWYDPDLLEYPWKYKSEMGIRIFGEADIGPGDPKVKDPKAPEYPVEVWPYTDPWAPFNPQLEQAPRKDSLTFNPAYMDKYNYALGDENGVLGLYEQISIREHDAREKAFFRMWYEPAYLDKILTVSPKAPFTVTTWYEFPALMQEFTYMYLDTMNQPAHAQPGTSRLVFPMATGEADLPMPVGPGWAGPIPSLGVGLTSFDANFDGQPDIVHLHSERSLNKLTNVNADFNGDGMLNELDKDGKPLSGDEMVVFALEEMVLRRGQSVQFLDHLITLENVIPGSAEFQFWYTGGGLHLVSPGLYSHHPDKIGTPLLVGVNRMALANKSTRSLLPTTGNLGRTDGAWFVFVNAVNSRPADPANESVVVTVGRALGATHSAIDNGSGGHDLKPGDPWYLKRFFVDGHEYNVVALHIVPATYRNPGDELYEFKYITIRTPVPKVDFVNYEDSIKLEVYYPVTGTDISVLPPFNMNHTEVEDVQALDEKTPVSCPANCVTQTFAFANKDLLNADCHGRLFPSAIPPLTIHIMTETVETQFSGELKEKYNDNSGVELWQTEQFHTVPDHYTTVLLDHYQMPEGYRWLTLLTSDWESEQSRLYLYGCDDITQNDLHSWHLGIPATNLTITGTKQTFFQATENATTRVKFLYDPLDEEDLYVNRWSGNEETRTTLRVYGDGLHSVRKAPVPAAPPTPTPTATATVAPSPTPTLTPIPGGTGVITGTVRLQGRLDHSGVLISAGGRTAVSAADGKFTIGGLGPGSYLVRATAPGYLYADKPGVAVVNGAVTGLAPVMLIGGDCDGNCKINLFDLVLVAINYGSQPPTDARADVNGNGKVDIYDLVLVGANMDKQCPGGWVAPASASALSLDPAFLEVEPTYSKVKQNDVFTVTLALDQASGVYGVDVQLSFAASVLEVVDADPFKEGVQVVHGSFPDPALGSVAEDEADNEAGTVRYAMTLLNPAQPASGQGDVFHIVFRAKADGFSKLTITSAALVDKNAQSLPVIKYDGSVQVAPKSVYMPLGVKSEPR